MMLLMLITRPFFFRHFSDFATILITPYLPDAMTPAVMLYISICLRCRRRFFDFFS